MTFFFIFPPLSLVNMSLDYWEIYMLAEPITKHAMSINRTVFSLFFIRTLYIGSRMLAGSNITIDSFTLDYL